MIQKTGEKVFESKDSNFCWDGKYKKQIMDAALFIFCINAKFKNIESKIIKTGNLSLLR